MDRLWTPWRGEYVSSAGHGDVCFLCQKQEEDLRDRNLVVYKGRFGYILLNLYPYNSGHLLVAPYDHVAGILDMDSKTSSELWEMIFLAVQALTDEYQPGGFNIGMNLGRVAGAGEPGHVHLHVVPRWGGDTNYMPVTAGTKVLPESLEQTYNRLLPHFP